MPEGGASCPAGPLAGNSRLGQLPGCLPHGGGQTVARHRPAGWRLAGWLCRWGETLPHGDRQADGRTDRRADRPVVAGGRTLAGSLRLQHIRHRAGPGAHRLKSNQSAGPSDRGGGGGGGARIRFGELKIDASTPARCSLGGPLSLFGATPQSASESSHNKIVSLSSCECVRACVLARTLFRSRRQACAAAARAATAKQPHRHKGGDEQRQHAAALPAD